jgi:hypothetical protein
MAIEAGRQWWAFPPICELAAPAVRDTGWPRNKIGRFLLAKLEGRRFTPSATAEKRTLARRAYIGLLSYKPA